MMTKERIEELEDECDKLRYSLLSGPAVLLHSCLAEIKQLQVENASVIDAANTAVNWRSESERKLADLKANPVADCPVCGEQPMTDFGRACHVLWCSHIPRVRSKGHEFVPVQIMVSGRTLNSTVVAWNEECAKARAK